MRTYLGNCSARARLHIRECSPSGAMCFDGVHCMRCKRPPHFEHPTHGTFLIRYRAPLETSLCRDCRICCDAGKALSPALGLEALPWREHRRQRTASGKSSNRNTLVLSYVDLRTKASSPCAQNRLAQNQNCIRLGLGRFSEVPYIGNLLSAK